MGGRVKKGMSFGAVDVDDGSAAATAAASGGEEVRAMPAEVSWEMLDKSRFFLLGAALFSGVSAALYPAVVLKTHLQVSPPPAAAASTTAAAILRRHGPRGFYRGFGASLAGTVPRAPSTWPRSRPPRAPWAPPPSASASRSRPRPPRPRPRAACPPPSRRRSCGPPSTSSASA